MFAIYSLKNLTDATNIQSRFFQLHYFAKHIYKLVRVDSLKVGIA